MGSLFHGINLLPGIHFFLLAWLFYFGRDSGIDIPGKIVVFPGVTKMCIRDSIATVKFLLQYLPFPTFHGCVRDSFFYNSLLSFKNNYITNM